MKLQTLLLLMLLPFYGMSQQTINASITHDGMQRDYIIYVPANYTGNDAVPLVLNYHGYTSNANEQMWYGDFRAIADTAGFIVVHPEGTVYQGSTHWNVGGWTIGSTVDDVGFTSALLDSLHQQYNIDVNRTYATGMSNGGFMSFLLACQLSDRIAAIASVTGSMTPQTTSACNPQRPVAILQIHGTQDGTVPYGGDTWTEPVTDAVDWWVTHNNCDATPTVAALPDVNTNDGSTVEHFIYANGDNNVTSEHMKVTGGDHTWPGTAFVIAGTNLDIDASVEIWKFFMRHELSPVSSTADLGENQFDIAVYPNPTDAYITIESNIAEPTEFVLYSALGAEVQNSVLSGQNQQIDISELTPNVYFLRIGSQILKVIKN